jgi:small-conductance mechanosensitive channel
MIQSLLNFTSNFSQQDSISRGLFLSIITIVVVWVFYKICTKGIRIHLKKKAHKPENVQNFLLMWRYVWAGIGAVLVIISLSGSIATLGISAAFLGMIFGWSLQAPVTGIAAWVMIVLKRPFKLGDRIIVNGIIGDVIDITLTHIILNQVGGTISGEEVSGRTVLVPNGILFQQVIYNYTLTNQYILDEVVISITYASDAKKAKEILIESASIVTENIIKVTKKQPFVRTEIYESGIRFRLRYQSRAKDRQRISSDINERIVSFFNAQKGIEFAYPHTEIIYQPSASGA